MFWKILHDLATCQESAHPVLHPEPSLLGSFQICMPFLIALPFFSFLSVWLTDNNPERYSLKLQYHFLCLLISWFRCATVCNNILACSIPQCLLYFHLLSILFTNEAYAPWGQGHLCLTHNQGWFPVHRIWAGAQNTLPLHPCTEGLHAWGLMLRCHFKLFNIFDFLNKEPLTCSPWHLQSLAQSLLTGDA